LSLLATLVVGLAPALQGTRISLTTALHGAPPIFSAQGGRLSGRTVLVVAQVSISLALAIVAGLLSRSALRSENVDLGFQPAGVLKTDYDLSRHGYTPARAAAFTRRFTEAAGRLGSVRATALASHLPLTGGLRTTRVWSPERGDRGAQPHSRFAFVSAGYFRALGIPLIRGRDVVSNDSAPATREAVVSEILAARLWPTHGGIGARLRTGLSTTEYVVVGIARDTRASSLWRDKEAAVYLAPGNDVELTSTRLMVVPATDDVAADLLALARELEPEVAFVVTRLESAVALWMLPSRAAGVAGAAIAAIALLNASLGIYGVLAHLLAQQTREFGIRSALGATGGQLVHLSLRQGLRLVLPGLLCGLLLGHLIARVVAGFLYDLSPNDGLTYVVAALVVGVASLAACYLPAHRAARVDPIVALRIE
jgi:putative ABC transport system permease protein